MYWAFSYIAFFLARAIQIRNSVLDKFNFCLFYLSGFLIVAACVMTFEARDSAAKVVPATTTNHVEDPANPQKVITFVFLLT